ncbi:hypothetical protein PINS_up000309 [Pythium insidiosum]|nr:hypothetical protein PINS_up000309 [Pythium insidiosum]
MSLGHAYGYEIDWWAIGVIVHEMMAGRPPWSYRPDADMPLEQYFAHIRSAADAIASDPLNALPLSGFSDDSRRFVGRLLCVDPRERLGHNGVEEVMGHAWFHGIDWDALCTSVPSSPYDPIRDFNEHGTSAGAATVSASSSSAESIDPDDNAKFFADF